jgi:hypothetical protein
MFNNISYNVVVERFKVFADGHFLIKRFTHGQVDQTDLEKDQLFPWMHVAPVEVRAAAGARVFTFDVIFADIPRDKEDKPDYQKESISDCIRLAEDLLSEIQNGQVVFSSLVEVEGESTITPFIEEWTHTLSGCTLALTISVPNDYNACDIPADWSIGGGGSGTPPSPLPSLILRVNNVDNTVQNVLDLVDGTNVTIEDLGDGRVRINSTGGGGGSGTLISTEFNQNHVTATGNPYLVNDVVWYGGSLYRCIATNDAILPTNSSYWTLVGSAFRARQSPVDWNATSGDYQILNKPTLATVATTGDYNDLDNLPTIPSIDGLVPYTGASQNVNLGEQKLKTESATGFTEIAPTYVTARNADSTKYSNIERTGVTVVDDAAGDTMNMNAGGLTFPDASSQYTAAVNADWNATSGLAEILNKPTFPPVIGDMLKSVYDTDADGVVDASETVQITVRNSTGSTLLKGQIVYLSGATGNRPNAVLADASTEATSSKTIGFVIANIANNSDGQVAVSGTLHDLDTSSFTAGDTLWLSETAGASQANTPPAEPAHAVFLGYIARSHPTQGRVIIAIQNGYELNELHGVQVPSPAANDMFYYDGGTDLWQSRQLTASHITDSTTVGQSMMKLTNPSAIRFLRINTDNSVTARTAAEMVTDLGIVSGTFTILGQSQNASTIPASSTYFGSLFNGAQTIVSSDNVRRTPMVTSGTLSRLYVQTSAAQPATGSLVCTVRKNSVDQALTLTIAAGSAAGVFTDLVNTVSVVAGDLMGMKFQNNATTVSANVLTNQIQLTQ